MNTYPPLMEWHLKQSGAMEDYEELKDCDDYTSREVLMKKLRRRYNMENKCPRRKKVKLPVSGTVISITYHDPGAVIQALPTDPRIKDADYFFMTLKKTHL